MSRSAIIATVIFCWVMSAAAAAFNVSISGTVKKEDGSVLAGAKVNTVYFKKFFKDSLAATSDAQGRFTITAANVAVRQAAAPRQALELPFKFRNNALVFSPALGRVNGTVAIHSADGKTLFSTAFADLKAGCQGIMLPRLMPGMNVMRLAVAGNRYTQELLCVGNAVYSKSGFGYLQKAASPSMAKRVAVVDTLLVVGKDAIDGRLPLDSYTKSNVSVSMSGGVLRSKFLISNNMIPGWKTYYSTVDSSFLLFSASNLYEDIDGGFERYTDKGMLQAADLYMIGGINSEKNNYLLQSPSFIMDFGTEEKARAMYQSGKAKENFNDTESVTTIPGFDTSLAYAAVKLGGIQVYSYYKQFYFDIILTQYPEMDTARADAKKFLNYWASKAQ